MKMTHQHYIQSSSHDNMMYCRSISDFVGKVHIFASPIMCSTSNYALLTKLSTTKIIRS